MIGDVMDQIKIGKFIAEQRKEKNLTQKQLADLLGVTNKSVSRWETGVNMPDLSLFVPLSEALDISLVELLEGKKIMDDKQDSLENSLKNTVIYSGESIKKEKHKFFVLIQIIFVVLVIFATYRISWYSNELGKKKLFYAIEQQMNINTVTDIVGQANRTTANGIYEYDMIDGSKINVLCITPTVMDGDTSIVVPDNTKVIAVKELSKNGSEKWILPPVEGTYESDDGELVILFTDGKLIVEKDEAGLLTEKKYSCSFADCDSKNNSIIKNGYYFYLDDSHTTEKDNYIYVHEGKNGALELRLYFADMITPYGEVYNVNLLKGK